MTSPSYRPNRRHFIQSVAAGFAGLSWPIRELAAERQWTAIQKLIDAYVADEKLAGAGAMLTMRLLLPFGSSQTWQSVAGWITALYQGAAN